jgi:hypothetical protein
MTLVMAERLEQTTFASPTYIVAASDSAAAKI